MFWPRGEEVLLAEHEDKVGGRVYLSVALES